MPTFDRRLLRLAVALHDHFASRDQTDRFIELPSTSWQRCTDLVRQIRRAELRGWHLAARELSVDLRFVIPGLQAELTELHHRLPAIEPATKSTSVGDIYADLAALHEEFEDFSFDLSGRWLSVTTEPIELEGIFLGPFEIRFERGRHSNRDSPAYRVIALDPHPAESRENVTHPHVMDEQLCEGDAKNAVKQALSQGRLLDFFMLVAGVLRTYNGESAFIELALWYGQSCSDCGAVVSEEDRYVCHRCGETVCDECQAACSGCEDWYCSNCRAACAVCEGTFCSGCLQRCDGCRESVCRGCLENERCANCHEEENSESIESGEAFAGAAIQSHGVGQAAISA